MKPLQSIISNVPLFDGLPQEQLDALFKISRKKQFNKADLIFTDGEEGNGFFLILEGKVKVYKIAPDGKEHILHLFDSGELFGEVPVFSGKSFPANAEAIQKTKTLFFPKNAFVALISQHPNITMNMLAVLSKRLREFTIQIENLTLKEISGRIASYLIFLSREHEHSDIVTLGMSKGHLASLLGSTPETVSRILSKMSTLGLIQVKGRTFKLLDRDGLNELSEHG
ncbi:MAG: Crp/Fnr family transcriptional regulator, partial [Desulfobacterales bacterium]|nr:Crp/Fnr family transcriptional regulator [Desulfobacterales bacterium]